MKLKSILIAIVCLCTVGLLRAGTPEDSLLQQRVKEKAIADSLLRVAQQAAADTTPVILKMWCPGDRHDSCGYVDDQLIFRLSTLYPFRNDPDKIVLYVDGAPIGGIAGIPNTSTNEIRFQLKRDPELLRLYQVLTRSEDFRLSPGLLNGYYVKVERDNFHIFLYSHVSLACGIIICAFMLFMFIRRGASKNNMLLRDPNGAFPKPFSLSKTQLAFWTFIIATSLIYLWLVTGEYNVLTTQAMLLLGISVGTTSLSTLVAAGHPDAVKAQLAKETSQGFFTDLLSDAKGISITRLQNFIFTGIYGMIFMVTVITQLRMPELDANALILMGISSGTYVVYKTMENNGGTPQPPAPPTPDPTPEEPTDK